MIPSLVRLTMYRAYGLLLANSDFDLATACARTVLHGAPAMDFAAAFLPNTRQTYTRIAIVDRQVAMLRGRAARIVIVGGRAGRAAPAGTTVVADRLPGTGALGALYTALDDATSARTLVLACDMPKVAVDLLKLLLCRAVAFDGAVPWIQGRPEPLCAVYSHRCLAPFSQALEEGHRRDPGP